jgi:uncharacterized membrane protein (DUF373 family)
MIKKIEKLIIVSMIFMMGVVILISTIELGALIVKDIMEPPRPWLEINQLFEIFGFFLIILIGVELLETIKAYLAENVVHSEIVLEVALIAISRKVIILEVKEFEPLTVIGIAALILAIAVSFFLIKKCRIQIHSESTVSSKKNNSCNMAN